MSHDDGSRIILDPLYRGVVWFVTIKYLGIIIVGLIFPTWEVGYLGIEILLCLVKDTNLSSEYKFNPQLNPEIPPPLGYV